MSRRRFVPARLLGLAVFALAWEVASRWLGPYWVPGIGQVVGRLWDEARAGRLLMFPPYWMYQHAGLPPRSSDKYIISTYLLF